MTPHVSIVLPTYNGSRYIRQSLESCVAQTYRDWELIVVDDASKDDTPSIVQEFVRADERIRIVKNGTNLGLPRTLNHGFEHARGQILTWTSDDNRYRPRALESMVRFLEKHPEIGLVYSDYTVIDEEGLDLKCVNNEAPQSLPVVNCVGCSFAYRRAVADAVGPYDPDLTLVEDWDYWLRAAKTFTLAHIPEDLYLYRRHPGSLSSTRKLEISKAVDRLQSIHLRDRRLFTAADRAAGLLSAMARAKAEGRSKDVRRHYMSAFRQAPGFVWRSGRSLMLSALVGERLADVASRTYWTMRRSFSR